jgi:hypothetical protein
MGFEGGACLELHIGTRARGTSAAAVEARPDAPPSSSSKMSSNDARFCFGRALVHSHKQIHKQTRKQIHLAALDADAVTTGDGRECDPDCIWSAPLPIVLLEPPHLNPFDE